MVSRLLSPHRVQRPVVSRTTETRFQGVSKQTITPRFERAGIDFSGQVNEFFTYDKRPRIYQVNNSREFMLLWKLMLPREQKPDVDFNTEVVLMGLTADAFEMDVQSLSFMPHPSWPEIALNSSDFIKPPTGGTRWYLTVVPKTLVDQVYDPGHQKHRISYRRPHLRKP